MTDTTNNYNQLLELAVLDSHGLLEPIEAELFTKSFHNAPASIQDEIIKLQRELAEDDSLLPLGTPAPALKQKVLQAVTDAADQEARRLAPLALIGARERSTRSEQQYKSFLLLENCRACFVWHFNCAWHYRCRYATTN